MQQEAEIAAAIKAFVTKAQTAAPLSVDAAIDQYAKSLAKVIVDSRPKEIVLQQGLRLTGIVNGISTTFQSPIPLILQFNT